ncbi:MAG: histidinol-phosphatase [Candidatus Diapherotrites archaeon CG08_land_8_20_14_0_20_34_12]|nr:MAG: histidinol-phosphatase [Candidatus Diapherotrites archaeon CG08_land_8_20_14_0_20_34_12]
MLFDLHVHSYYSKDSANKPLLLLKIAQKKGIGFAITDHNSTQGWDEFKKENLQYKIPLIYGEEIKIYRNGSLMGELLAYFLQEEIKFGEVEEVLDALKAQGALISIAHPFDYTRPPLLAPTKELDLLKQNVHAVECFNSRCYTGRPNKRARHFAEENMLSVTAGSDAHFPAEFGNALVETEANSLEEFRKKFSKNKISSLCKLSPKKFHIYTKLIKSGFWKKEKFFDDMP